MAIGRLSVKTGNKGKAKAHAKYILREDKYAKRIEEKGDILEKKGHGNMPEWAKDNPNFFWEMADEMERKNGSAYREHIITLPRELNAQQRLELVQDWIKNEIGDKHPYSFAIHNPPAMDGKEQPHCHLMFCERELDGIKRSPDQFFKRYNAKSPEKGGAKKLNTGLDYTTRKQQLKDLRQRWEKTCNKHLLKVSKFVQISMKSLKDRGIDRQPTNISMAEMNKPSIKEAYKEKLNASKEFIQAYVQVGKGMNVKAELAKEPAKETPAPKPAEPKQPQATPPKAPAVAPKSTPSTADKLERPAPKPATPPPTEQKEQKQGFDFKAIRRSQLEKRQAELKQQIDQTKQLKGLATNHDTIKQQTPEIQQEIKQEALKRLSEIDHRATNKCLMSDDIEAYQKAKGILNSVERLEEQRQAQEQNKKQSELTAVSEPKPQPKTQRPLETHSKRLEPQEDKTARVVPPQAEKSLQSENNGFSVEKFTKLSEKDKASLKFLSETTKAIYADNPQKLEKALEKLSTMAKKVERGEIQMPNINIKQKETPEFNVQIPQKSQEHDKGRY